MEFKIIRAEACHVSLILSFIRQLAAYEKLENDVIATEEDIAFHLFEKKSAECILAYEGDTAIGFALFFYNYSTFLGKQGLYLEDLFVNPEYRGKGYGKKMLLHIAGIAMKKNCGRMEWSVLNWNKPAIDFYEKLGALPMSGWTVYRLTEDKLKALI